MPHAKNSRFAKELKSMLYKGDIKDSRPQNMAHGTTKPPNCEEFKACLTKALKLLEERYRV